GSSRFGRWLHYRRVRIAFWIAVAEGVLIVFHAISWWAAIVIAALVLASWFSFAHRLRSDTVRQAGWTLAVSQALVALVPVLVLIVGTLALIIVVTSPETQDAIAGDRITVAVQPEARGTGDAVAAAHPALDGFGGDILVLSGDSPLLTPGLLEGLVESHRAGEAAATVLTFEPDRALPYGRIVRDGNGQIDAIVEQGDATDEQRRIRELNSSTYVFSAPELWATLNGLRPDNAQD